MAKHIWTVLCKTSIVDSASNVVSLIEVLEEITVGLQEPVPDKWSLLPMQGHLVVFIERSDLNVPERVQLKMEIAAPSGEISPQTIEAAIALTDNNKRSRTTIQLPRLPMRAFGVHKFIMYLRQNADDTWARISETPVEIKGDATAIQTSALGQPKTPVKKSRKTKKAADQA